MQGSQVHGGLPRLHRLGDPAGRRRLLRVSPIAEYADESRTNLPPKPYEVAVANPATLPVFGARAAAVHGERVPAELALHAQPGVLDHPLLPALPAGDRQAADLQQRDLHRRPGGLRAAQSASATRSSPSRWSTSAPRPCRSTPTPTPTPCPPQSPTIYVNPHEHRIIDTLHRDLIRVTILGTSNFQVKRHQPVHRDAGRRARHRAHHAEGPARRVPDGHLRLRGRPVAPAQGAEQRHPRGHAEQRRDDVRVEQGGAEHPVCLDGQGPAAHTTWAAGRSTRPWRRSRRSTPAWSSPRATPVALSRSANPAPGKTAKLEVSYAPVVHAAGKESRAGPPRGPWSRSSGRMPPPPTHVAKLPTMLRHSMSDYLNQVDRRRPEPARARAAG